MTRKYKTLDVNCLRRTLHSDLPPITALNPRAHPNLSPAGRPRLCGYPVVSGRLLVRALKQIYTVKNVNVSHFVKGAPFSLLIFVLKHSLDF